MRSVLAGRGDVRDGDGAAPIYGRLPVRDGNEHSRERPIPLTKLSPNRPAHLERIVDKLVSKRADQRFQSARELGGELTSLARKKTTSIGRLLGQLFPR